MNNIEEKTIVQQRRVPKYEGITKIENNKMTGWKTKAGSIILSIGGVIVGSAEIAPVPGMVPWLKFIGFIVSGVGGALTVWGIGHKLEKAQKIKKVPWLIREI